MIDHSGACLHKLAELAKVRELVSLGILSFKKQWDSPTAGVHFFVHFVALHSRLT